MSPMSRKYFVLVTLALLISVPKWIQGKDESLNSTRIYRQQKVSGGGSSDKLSTLMEKARHYNIVTTRGNSYVEAANSFGHNGPPHGKITVISENSYGAPSPSSSYGVHSSSGYDDYDTRYPTRKGGGGKADLIGLLGLLGLIGLKGTIPLIKMGIATFIALLPILIPLTTLALLKPVITFGRDLNHLSIINRLREILEYTEESYANFPHVSVINNKKNYNGTFAEYPISSEVRMTADTRSNCMERIACEGLIRSLPRIIFRILGDNSFPLPLPVVKTRKRRTVTGTLTGSSRKDNAENEEEDVFTSRRKDLASLALNKLRNPQFLTRKPSNTEAPSKDSTCQQYKCPSFF